jgi:hypothetical protein
MLAVAWRTELRAVTDAVEPTVCIVAFIFLIKEKEIDLSKWFCF